MVKFSYEDCLGYAAFLLGFLSLWIPSGYSVGIVGLFSISMLMLFSKGLPSLSAGQYSTIFVMVSYSFLWMTDGVLRGDGLRDMDQASRFLFAVPVLMAFSQKRPSLIPL